MSDEFEQVKKQLLKLAETIEAEVGKIFDIEKFDISQISDPIEIEKIINDLFEIRNISTYSIKPLGSIQWKAIERRIEAERYLESLKQKALQEEELVFYPEFNFIFQCRF